MTSVTFTASGSWSTPGGVTTTDTQAWGEGGPGAAGLAGGGSHSGGGGGGGEYAEETALAVSGTITFTIGSGGTGTATSFPGSSVTVTAHAGGSASGTGSGSAGTGSANSIHHDGGAGGSGVTGSTKGGGGGGSSAGTASAGNSGTNGSAVAGSGGTAPSGGGNGGAGSSPSVNNQVAGTVPGGGGGGGGTHAGTGGAAGASGQITLTYFATVNQTATLAGAGTLTALGGAAGTATLAGIGTLTATQAGAGNATLAGVGTLTAHATQPGTATLAGAGTLTASGGLPTPTVVNQWASNYGQSETFGTTPPVLQSNVVPLTPAFSVGGTYSGTATAGNWLFCIASWTQVPSDATAHIGVGDDIHSWWREYPASNINGVTRTSISYTPNIARSVGNVYVAPDAQIAAINVLVVEIAGLGPWDAGVVTNANYAAASTSVSLSIGAPSQAAFFIGAVGGDNVANGQAFLPSGWTGLATQTQTNGTDHTADNILTSAFLPTTLLAQSVSGTASSSNLSGFMLAVYTDAAGPIPAGHNPNWPYLFFEAAFGGGFNTPNSELTWTDISNRLWSYDETSGVQYQLGQLQSTNLELELDNFDAALSSLNTASPYYPNVKSGTPIRIRAAMGTIAGVTANRWYVLQRNAQQWPEEIDPSYRRFSGVTGTDVWAVLSSTGPTPYRGEVYADDPYAWWPCDDQPGPGVVQPTTLLNAAEGNTNGLVIQPVAGGVAAGDAYTTTGVNATTDGTVATGIPGGNPPPTVAVYAVAAQSGWMYGDPQSTPSSALSGNAITATPGSAAWQQTGLQGSTGSNSWFLTCNDASFPGLSGGVSFGFWFNAGFFGSATGFTDSGNSTFDVAGQPVAPITLATLATASAPVMIVQLARSGGALNLITYNGGTPTSHSIYSASDLRSASWHHVMITTNGSSWTVYVDGGITATVSGSGAGMTSAWSWLALNADFGSGGGSSLASNAHGGNVAYSHIQVFPQVLPLWRVQAHYCAAITGFGLLPAPQSTTISAVLNRFGGVSYTPDGSEFSGSYGVSGLAVTSYGYSAVTVAQAGSYTSGPSSRTTVAAIGGNDSGVVYGAAVWVGWTSLCPSTLVYTSASANTETNAATACGSGDSFTSGYGAGASGHGVCQTAGGTGASPPAAPSALGDTVAGRIERALGYGNVTYPGRCIDPAPLLVQAALDVGGQQAGQNVENQALSDGGLLFIDNVGKLNYWMRSHLAGQYSSPVWAIGPTTGAGRTPYARDIKWILDPQQAYNAIEIQPYSPDGTSLPIITPSNAAGVTASQQQYGAQPFQINSYLQSTSEMQSQANWLFQFYGQPARRAEQVKIDAATQPYAWELVLGINVSDLVTLEDWQIGGGGTVYTYRVSECKRKFSYGDDREITEASVTLQLEPEPTSYWS